MTKLSTIYAQSLFELAIETGESKEILEDSLFVLNTLRENPSFQRLLDAPVVSKEEKTEIIHNVYGGKINTTLLNFLKVMAERKDCGQLAKSLEGFEELYNDYHGIQKATAITAVPISEVLQAKLKEKLEAITGKTILLENKVDRACIGGVVLQLGDMQTDNSVATQLKELNKQLKSI